MAINAGAGPHQAWINGFPVDSGSVEQQAVKKSSTYFVTLPLNEPGAESTFANADDGTSVVISVLARGIQANLLTGVIDTVEFDYINTKIHISGRDLSAKLHENLSSEKWLNKTGSEIVQDLAGRVGLSVSANVSNQLKAGKNLNQDYVKLSDNVTFSQIIHKLAEFDAARWWVDPDGTLHYADLGSPSGIYTINYQRGVPIVSDCLHLNVGYNVKASSGQQVTVKSWHPKDKKVYQGNSTGGGGAMIYNFHIPNLKQEYADQHAKARVKEIARHGICVRATVVGDPSVSAGMGLQLNGTGFWDKVYDLDTVHHRFGMHGYTTSMTAKAPKDG